MLYYIDNYRGVLLHDDHTGRFKKEPLRYIPLTAEQWKTATERRESRRSRFKSLTNSLKGKTVHVLGNGPSARDFVPDGNPVIGVNAAGLLNKLDYWIVMDRFHTDRDLDKWMREYALKPKEGTIQMTTPQVGAMTLWDERMREWNPDCVFDHIAEPSVRGDLINGLYSLQSTVHAALDLARHMGAAEIKLWGVDYNDRSHFYTGSTDIPKDEKDDPNMQWAKWHRHLEGFTKLKRILDHDKVKVTNMSPTSRLELWPKAESGIKVLPLKPKESGRVIHVFGTKDTPYEDEMRECVKRFAAFGVALRPVELPNNADWMRNCLSRAIWLHESNVWTGGINGLIDSDLYPEKDPSPFLTVPDGFDVTLHYQPEHKNQYDKCQASIVLFAPTEKGRKLLAEWARLCKEDQTPKRVLREQLYLWQAVEAIEPKIHDVGLAMNCRPEQRRQIEPGVIIEHRPASRKYLQVIGGKR